MTRVYVSGPMSNMPDLNFPAFHAAAAQLRAAGFEVVNPAEFGEEPGLQWADYMRKDIRALMDCDGIALLPGWMNSRGAQLERYIADQLLMPVRTVDGWLAPNGSGLAA